MSGQVLGTCKREDCAYRDGDCLCDYGGITGHCKLATPGYQKQDPSGKACMFYECGKSCKKYIEKSKKQRKKPKKKQENNPRPEPKKRGPTWDTQTAQKLWEEGKSDNEIAKVVRVDKSTIQHWRTAHNLPKNDNKRVAGWDTELGIKLYQDGMTAREVAERLGINKRTFQQYLRNHGVRKGREG